MDLLKVDRLINELLVLKLIIPKIGVNQEIINAVKNYQQALKNAIEIRGSDGIAYEVGNKTLPQIIKMVELYKHDIGMA